MERVCFLWQDDGATVQSHTQRRQMVRSTYTCTMQKKSKIPMVNPESTPFFTFNPEDTFNPNRQSTGEEEIFRDTTRSETLAFKQGNKLEH